MRLFRFLCCLWLLCGSASGWAQPLSAYVDIQRQFQVWDAGMLRKADYLQPVEYKIGRTTIPFLDNSRSFKIYYRGGVQKINDGFTQQFFTTDNLIAFLNAKSLNVFDRGTIKNLSILCDQYYVGDSIVLFKDGVRSEYKVYYDGQITPVENFLAQDAITTAQVSDNVAAYVNFANQFRIFWTGQLFKQEDYAVQSFGVGRNTVAYIDANRRFRVFHAGQTFTLDTYAPQSYTTGDNLVAFTTSDGYFKIFYGDSIRTIGFFQPEYIVGDNVVAYKDAGGYLRVFYKGELYTLDTYFPDKISVSYNSLAYVNRTNTLRMFFDGEIYDVTSGSDDWQLQYDVLRYSMIPNVYRVFWKGEDY
ncbi:MAG: hypothetical protein EOP52_06930 [Sphingobacteriales bacterium]|nr:MAG: hypothetical protein EOP52_06930 [Sphingobacteriales bacterium]